MLQSYSVKKRIGYGLLLPTWVLVGFLLANVIVFLALSSLQFLGVSFSSLNQSVFGAVTGALLYAVAISLVIGVPWPLFKRRTSRQDIGLHRQLLWKDIGIALLGLISYVVLSALVVFIAQRVLTFIDFDQVQDTGFRDLSARYEYILAFLTLVILAPVAEEILFRGYLFGKLRKVVPWWVAILLTSLLFGLVHFAWNVAIDVFAMSIVACLMTMWSKSLWPAILLHMLKNFIAFYFLFINPMLLTTM